MLKKKSIVLSDTNSDSNKKAVLNLQEDENGVGGSLRLYNFSAEPLGVSSLGMYVNQKIYKAGLTRKSNMFYEFFLDIESLPAKFSCAVINFQNAVATPLLYGASDGKDDEIYASIISLMSNDNSIENVEKTLDEFGVDYAEEEKEIIEKEIDEAVCSNCDSCASCIYKKYFYEHQAQASSLSEEKENINESIQQKERQEEISQPKSEQLIFVEKLKDQIDKLFEKNPIETNLQELIPNSKWVKIEYEDDGDFYVFGLLYDENNQAKYVCYGVPAVYEEEAPKELSGFPIWCALDKENKQGFGYWLTYQDAVTGEPIKAILD